jgi:hypothetical protein
VSVVLAAMTFATSVRAHVAGGVGRSDARAAGGIGSIRFPFLEPNPDSLRRAKYG